MGRQMEIPLVSFNISLTTGEGLLLFRKCAFCGSIRQVAMWYQETASLRVQTPFRSLSKAPNSLSPLGFCIIFLLEYPDGTEK